MNKNKNCENCGGNYEPYKIGSDSEVFGAWCSVSNPECETQGVCPFCNEKSKMFCIEKK